MNLNIRWCEHCGQPYQRRPYESPSRFAWRVYCSSSCAATDGNRRRAQQAGGLHRPRLLQPRPAWFDHAACRGATAVFFPPITRSDSTSGAYDRAREICARCPVLDQCRDWILATETDERHGMVAGMTPRERRIAARQARQAAS